ncbi:MAG: HAD family hydrolase [Vampirovibrionales bacterium]|nr:HAD family hydrolase [Vampirovibrionales bacterium]
MPLTPPSRVAVFLDRDGTLNIERGYLRQVSDVALIPEAAAAIRRLNDAGVLAILTTNQSGVARGFYDEAHVKALNERVNKLLADQAGARLDAMYYSPYLPTGKVPEYTRESECRKPATGMILEACKAFPEIDLTQSFVVGDKASDIEFAHNAGCKGILVKTGYGERVLEGKYQFLSQQAAQPWRICAHIGEAVDAILTEVFSMNT